MESNQVEVQSPEVIDTPPIVPEKKKRGRKPKPKPENPEPIIPKKRGRKPKGGKIINAADVNTNNQSYVMENIILHLKCNSNDFETHNNNNVEEYEEQNISFQIIEDFKPIEEKKSQYQHIIQETDKLNQMVQIDQPQSHVSTPKLSKQQEYASEDSHKIISEKLIELQKNFYFNDVVNNHSACFWCTYEFEHTSVHIPKYKMNEVYHAYGCFCSPECAVAHLINEQIDPSVKTERYQLINYLYNKIYNYTTGIKPAPNPYYTLDKFMGNLTIQEYRALLRQDKLFVVVEKPMTRVLPEIYEETETTSNQMDYLKTSNFKIKRATGKSVTKTPDFFKAK